MQYKLLALDMDGTLLNSSKKITPKTLEAINRLLERGVHVVISSGRNIPEMSYYSEQLKNIRYAVLMSGGMVYDFVEEKPIALHPISTEIALEIIDVGIAERAMIHIHSIRDSIVSRADVSHMADFHMGIYQDMFMRISTFIDDPKQFALEHRNEIVKVNLYNRSIESQQKALERIKHLPIEPVFAEETNIESSPRGISKASGLLELCKHLGISIDETIAIGDAPNDLEILQTAGVGIAMGNADERIKSIADFVTDDNDHDGIARAVEEFFQPK